MNKWKIPDPITGYPLKTLCIDIPDAPEYRRAFFDCILQITQWFNWERDVDRKAKDVTAYLKNILIPQEMKGFECFALIDFRNNPFDNCQVDVSTDGGLTWRAAWRFDLCQPIPVPVESALINTDALVRQGLVARYEGGGIPGLNPSTPTDKYNGDDSTERNAALCAACKAYVTKIAQDFHTRAGIALGLSSVLVGGGAMFGIIGIPAIVVGVVLIDASEQEYDASGSQLAINNVICCMVDGLTGQDLTRDNFQGSLTGCGFDVDSPSDLLRSLVEQSFLDFGNWIAFIDGLGNAFDLTAGGLEDCPCGCDIPLEATGTTLVALTDCLYEFVIPAGTDTITIIRTGGGCFTVTEWDMTDPGWTSQVLDCGAVDYRQVGTWVNVNVEGLRAIAARPFDITVHITVTD